MDIETWGHSGWKFLHACSFMYDHKSKNRRREYINAYKNIGNILPCGKCRQHYNEYQTKHPIENIIDEPYGLAKWLVDLHNEVNEDQNKPRVDFETVKNHYIKEKCPELTPPTDKSEVEKSNKRIEQFQKKETAYISFLVFLIIIIIVIVVKKR